MRYATPLLLGLSLSCFGSIACSDDTGDSNSGTEDTSGDGDPGDGDPGDGDGDPGDGDPGDGDGDPGDGDGDPGDGDGDPGDGDPGDGDPGDGDPGDGDGDPNACEYWEITYDLEGSIFEISDTPFGAGDQVNTLTMPYDADDHVGPGSITLRFEDVNGEPDGTAYIVHYEMTMNFVVSGATTVTTDLNNEVPFDECGVTSGILNVNEAQWEPADMPGHHSMGTILCEGNLCGFAGFQDGVPEPIDEVSDHPLENFVFGDDRASFTVTMPIVVQSDNNSTTSWDFVGTETNRALVDGPDCLCNP